MSSNTSLKMKNAKDNLIILVAIIVGINQFLMGQIVSAGNAGTGNVGTAGSSKIQVADNASDSEVIAAILPQEKDTVRPYTFNGKQVTLSAQVPDNGYDMLVAMNKAVSLDQLTPEQSSRYKDLTKSIYHPCCNAPVGGCGCKHAIAAQGIIKYLLTQNWTDDQILDEVFLWNRYWWPKHYATAALYLNKEGTNPGAISSRDWLSSKMSTIRAGRRMKAAIGS